MSGPPPGFQIDPLPTPRGAAVEAGRRADDPLRRLTALRPKLAVTSGQRSPSHNRRVGGVRNSRHIPGDAVDLVDSDLDALYRDAVAVFPKGATILRKKDHVHVQRPGWGGGKSVGNLPAGFEIDGPVPPQSLNAPLGARPTGQVHDGDTFRLSTGQNARLFGVDAWELAQQGRTRDGSLLPLGRNARDALVSGVSPATTVFPTGEFTFGRPVVNLDNGGRDPAAGLLRGGHALASPQHLQGDPRLSPYMEAERLARMNLLGGHGTNAETPAQFRRKDGPWQGMEPGKWGEGQAVFGDEPTPFYGLRPEIEQGYLAIWQDLKSKPEDLIAFATANGFNLDGPTVRARYAERNKPKHHPTGELTYMEPPRPLTDPGDGKVGTTLRGVGDPFNLLDELGGVADTLGIGMAPDGARETIFNSDRRFGDVLWNNIDQNRSVIAHDDATHPYYRLGGQIASGVVLPYGAGARTIPQLARLGAAEGFAAGFGAGEGGITDRLPNAVVGSGLGLAGGAALGGTINAVGAGWRAGKRVMGRRDLGDTATAVQPENASAAQAAMREAIRGKPLPPAAMRMEDEPAELVGPIAGPPERQRDYIDIGSNPPPQGFELDPFNAARPMSERLSPEAMARLADDVDPRSVLPRPPGAVEDMSEAARANPGTLRDLQAPDEFAELGVRKIPSRKDLYKTSRIRGPIDITQSLRMLGGVKDEGGDLASMGISNAPRRMAFGSNEQFLGKLVDNDNGMPLDEATERLWEEGYFPDFDERPTINDLLKRLDDEARGIRRYFHPDDAEEVARFESARADRYRIEEAANSGAPLADDVGEEINFDDLVANDPPLDAYEETPRLTGKLGNINLANIEDAAGVARLIDQVQKRVGGFSAAARGRITNEETRKLAQEIGLKPEQLLKRRAGQALNAEQLYAVRALAQKARLVVANLARKAVGGSDEDKLRFKAAWLRYVAIEEQVTGATAETGRALQAMKMIAKGGDARAEGVRAYLRGGKGIESVDDAARAIVDLMEDPAKASHFMREGLKPRWRDKFNELWVNSLLSGPVTHVVNFTGNMLTTLLSLPEQALTAGIGKVLRSADRAYIGEVGARVSGLGNAAVDGLKLARRAFATGEPIDAVSKVEASHYQAIPGKLGQVVRIPTRALTAADEFWKAINANAELHQLAYRKAIQEGGGPEQWNVRYEELLRNPSEDMVRRAQEAARYYTFQKHLGPTGQDIQRIANNFPGAKIILPFVRTPINLLKFAGERSIFALLMPEVRGAIRAGGRSRDEALARLTIGSGLSAAAVMAALDGRISGGGPSDSRERAALMQSGWQPYSVRVGDQWVSYRRFDPLSMVIGAAADFAEVGRYATEKEKDDFAMNLALAVARNMTNKTWLSGLSDFFEMMSDPKRYGPGWVRRLAGSAAVPNLLNQSAQALDPHIRDVRTWTDAIRARVPVLSQSLPVRRDVWGEPVERGNALGPDVVSPIFRSAASHDPVRQEIARLRVPLTMPKRYMKIEGKRVDLTPEQFDELVQLSGQPAKKYLDGVVRLPMWRQMRDDERVEFVREALKEFRAAGREGLIERHPELKGADLGDEPAVPPVMVPGMPGQPPLRAPPQQPSNLPPGFVID